MNKSSRTVVALVALNLIVVPLGFAGGDRDDALPTAEEVIERYVGAVGGRPAIENLTTRICVGRLVHDLSWKTPSHQVVPFATYGGRPGHVLMVEHGPEGVRCEGSDGEVTWVQSPSGVTLKSEPFRSKTAWLIDPQNALRIGEYFPDLKVTSIRAIDDKQVYVLESSELDPAHYALSFDIETGLLSGIGYYWYLQDYRDVDGVKFPYRVTMSRKGGSSTFMFDLVEHNLPLGETLFAAPTPSQGSDR